MSDELVERLCQAHWNARVAIDDADWSNATRLQKIGARQDMRAALAILSKPENISEDAVKAASRAQFEHVMTGEWPDGMTPTMIEAWRKAIAAAIGSLLK